MRVTAKVGKHELHILVDCGSTHNFLDDSVAKKIDCQPKTTCRLDVTVGGGKQLISNSECKGFMWRIKGETFVADMIILPLEGCEMVLGIQWLATLGDIKCTQPVNIRPYRHHLPKDAIEAMVKELLEAGVISIVTSPFASPLRLRKYAMVVRTSRSFQEKRCGNPNHLIREGPKPPKEKNQRSFVRGSWSDSGEEDDEKPGEWIKDSGCSKHMTGNRKFFSSYKAYDRGNVIFGSNLRGNIIGKGTISYGSLNIANVEHVDNLGFNLLSVGQICDSKCKVIFSEHDSEITKDEKVIGRGIRKSGLYVMKLGKMPKDRICLATIDENSTLWRKRLGH
ncbi:retrovirus-related pol polyprotein from transposon TNT 1-94 [Tanacetum coccineum]